MFEANVNKFFIMKKLTNLKGVKTLNKSQQKSINGGGPGGPPTPKGPCGETGGTTTNDTYSSCIGYGYVWSNGECWICY
jgi:hypothetical protein